MTDSDELATRLAAIRAKRGYLLPHHGLMAITSPELLDAYDGLYSALTLKPRVLSAHDQEFVWLAILVTTDEAIATHHLAKFQKAGGTVAEFENIVAITALAKGVGAYRFVGRHWLRHLAGHDPREAYLRAFRVIAAGTSARLAHMAAAVVHACTGEWQALAWQLVAAYRDRVPETELAEGLSLTMFPGSVPNFVEAAEVWRKLIVSGEVEASAPFRAWATLAGQGGYDEAAGQPPIHR